MSPGDFHRLGATRERRIPVSLYVHLTKRSFNKKTGPMPVSTSSANTCPPSCRLRKSGCYANTGPLRYRWQEVSEGRKGTDWNTFCAEIAALPAGIPWRHNQAGDLPGSNGIIDSRKLALLVEANRWKHGFTFTHYRPTAENAAAILAANASGFCINLSADGLAEAERFARLGIAPVVTLLPEPITGAVTTPRGWTIVPCLAQLHDFITCVVCRLCEKIDRSEIVGFVPHGSQKKTAELLARKLGCLGDFPEAE